MLFASRVLLKRASAVPRGVGDGGGSSGGHASNDNVALEFLAMLRAERLGVADLVVKKTNERTSLAGLRTIKVLQLVKFSSPFPLLNATAPF